MHKIGWKYLLAFTELFISLAKHYDLVEIIIQRFSVYGLKINFSKSAFGQKTLKFLGWIIGDGKLTADPKRIEKIKDFPYPQTRKQLMSFMGLINTLKRVSPLTIGTGLAVLQEPVSQKYKFCFEPRHRAAFDFVKEKLCTQPLFANLIDPLTDKIIFSDASKFAMGSVLMSKLLIAR